MDSEMVDISKYGFSILQIETMSVCDMSCKFCVYPQRSDKGKILDDETISNIIDSLHPESDIEHISFQHINEPLLDKRIYKFIKYSKEKRFPVVLITNGLSFNSKEIIQKLSDSRPDYVRLSLQTPSAEFFRSARGIDYSFEKYKQGIFEFLKIARIKSLKVIIDIACSFSSVARKIKINILGLSAWEPSVYSTVNSLKDDLKQFLYELQNYDEHFIFYRESFDRYLDKVGVRYKEQEGFNISENIAVKIKPFAHWNRLVDFYPIGETKGCSNDVLGVLASGYVVPCCFAYGDLLNMGDVNKDSLSAILKRNSSLINGIRTGINMPLVCQRCQGTPTRRGRVVRQIKNKISNILRKGARKV